LTSFTKNSTMKESVETKEGYIVGVRLEKRELYIDVVVEESVVDEILLYQVDFLRIRHFVPKSFYINEKKLN